MEDSSPSEQDALEQQQVMLESCLDLAFQAYDEALQQGTLDPVVILLDIEDHIGGQIAEGWFGPETMEEVLGESAPGETMVCAHAFAWKECQKAVPEVFPFLAPVFEKSCSDDGFLAISVTCGGASALTVPHSARESGPATEE